jgi:hypothetical protein
VGDIVRLEAIELKAQRERLAEESAPLRNMKLELTLRKIGDVAGTDRAAGSLVVLNAPITNRGQLFDEETVGASYAKMGRILVSPISRQKRGALTIPYAEKLHRDLGGAAKRIRSRSSLRVPRRLMAPFRKHSGYRNINRVRGRIL